MHALRRIHRSLRAEGLLLDLHPEPENSGVEVWLTGRVEHLGQVDQEQDKVDILAARACLDMEEGEGWYVTERQEFFDLLMHFPSHDAWVEYQAREGYVGVVSGELLELASRLLAKGGGEFVVREPIRASLLRRRPAPGGDVHEREDPDRCQQE